MSDVAHVPLVYNSPELKAQVAFLITFCLTFIYMSICMHAVTCKNVN